MVYKARLSFLLQRLPFLQSIMRRKMRPLSRPPLWKPLLVTCSAILAVQALAGTAIAQSPAEPALAPILNEGMPNTIPGQYIVVFKQGVAREAVLSAQEKIKGLGGEVRFTYTSALSGFSVKVPPEAVQALRALPGVAYIEANQMGSGHTTQPPNPPTAPPSGLDRTDRRLLPLNNTYTYSETGAGVNAYVIDSGIRATHSDFGGRASGAVDFVMDGNGTNDCHGHGTNVAGIVGGTGFGIAKGVTIHAVRVLDCNNRGFVDSFIAGVDWVTNNAVHPAIANMSIGTDEPSTTLDTAITNSIASGVAYTLSAGNNSLDACNTSPARVPTAITVGSIDPANDTRAGDSNFGTCLDLFAPGVNIVSAGIANDTSTSTFSGTSQAAPHVAGVAARFLQNHTAANPAAVWAAIHNANNVTGTAGWAGVVSAGAGSPNELLHWGSFNDGVNDSDGLKRYSVKFICGKADGKILAPGNYATAINIQNPNHDPNSAPVEIRKRYSVALPGETSGGTTPFIAGNKLNPGEAFEIDCPDILGEVRQFCEGGFLCKGFATVEGTSDLEIVAVYSAGNPGGSVRSIHTERVGGHCPVRTQRIDGQTLLFIPPHTAGDSEFKGHGPCVRFSLDLLTQDQGTALVASYFMHAFECNNFDSPRSDFTAAEGRRETILFSAGPESRILGYSVANSMSESYKDTDHGDDFFAYAGNNPVLSLRFIGDTSGDEAGTKTGVHIGLRELDLKFEDCGQVEGGG
jgi:subtilisin family serine protease